MLALLVVCRPSSGQEIPFKMQEIDTKLAIGYAVSLVDVNSDGKKDIVVVDTAAVWWYENPSWKKRAVITGVTKPDNVCLDAYDIDGDGQVDFALGAEWKPFNTKSGGTLQWLKRGKSLEDPWSVFPIDEEPTIHRIRFADIDGSGKKALVSVPLMGQGATKEANWMDGRPVRIAAYRIPADPTKDKWEKIVLDESLHVIHNFYPIPGSKSHDILIASYEGVNLLSKSSGSWSRTLLGAGNQDNPKSNRGASEIKQGTLKGGNRYIATVEPWHGNQIVVYTEPGVKGMLWDRHVIDDELKWGHAVSCADLDGDGNQELIIGVRDDGGKIRRGVRVYRAQDAKGAKWTRQIIEDGGVAVEDLAAADLDGDGRMDLVAVGRATKNVRIYWNK
jgi:hypothetical protein